MAPKPATTIVIMTSMIAWVVSSRARGSIASGPQEYCVSATLLLAAGSTHYYHCTRSCPWNLRHQTEATRLTPRIAASNLSGKSIIGLSLCR